MILLDTNVISELMRPHPSEAVLAWINPQAPSSLYLCSVVLGELLIGLETMTRGKKQRWLRETLDAIRTQSLTNEVLKFDELSASFHGKLVAHAQSKGSQIGFADGQIAAIALQHDFAVATRDTAPFEAAGVKTINPWATE